MGTGRCTRTFNDHCPWYWSTVLVWEEYLYNVARDENTINEWSLADGKLLRTFDGHTGTVQRMIAFKGKIYSSSMDNPIKEWSLDTGECTRTFHGHSEGVNWV